MKTRESNQMPRNFIVIVSTILLMMVESAFAGDLAGHYRIEGTNPDGRGMYRGQAVVTHTGAAYQVTWQIGTTRYIGTGIQQAGVFSVMFQPERAPPGIAAYEVGVDGILTGTWTTLGGKMLGTETWTIDKGF